ncbi:MAG TPA: 23S rRNA (uracil(1939)-C(5))-methyltransferase RlmD [bacterium]|nr:23S rRNA (uracil(1939)-C(5))-methyltransferase RlmD [bacterium]
MAGKTKQVPPVKPGQEIEVQIDGLAYGGDATARYKGFAIFIPYAVPGSVVLARVTEVKSNFGSARVVRVIKESPDYIKPVCPHFGVCGGCDWLNIKYETQLKYKAEQIRHMTETIGGVKGAKINPFVTYKNPLHYRARSQYKLKMEKGKIRLGFYRARSHDITAVNRCFILKEEINNAAFEVQAALNSMKRPVKIYDERSSRGTLRHVSIRANSAGEVLITFVVVAKAAKEMLKEPAAVIMKKIRNAAGITININKEPGNAVFGPVDMVLEGKGYITERAAGIDFILGPASFFQVSPEILEIMAGYVAERSGRGAVLIDLYGGVGALTVPLHKESREIIVVESDRQNTSRFDEIARRNSVRNCRVINEKAEYAVEKLLAEKKDAVVVVDPPRKGLHPRIIQALRHRRPRLLIYISCNPATFARDLSGLKDVFNLEGITPVDQFAQTYHCELMAALRPK